MPGFGVVKSFVNTKIASISPTTEKFTPRVPVELSKAGEFGEKAYFGSPTPRARSVHSLLSGGRGKKHKTGITYIVVSHSEMKSATCVAVCHNIAPVGKQYTKRRLGARRYGDVCICHEQTVSKWNSKKHIWVGQGVEAE